MTLVEKSASFSAFALGSVGYLCLFLPTSALTSSHGWNPVAPFTASRKSSASRRFSTFSLIAASTTKFFRSPRRSQTATRASKRSAAILVASVRVFTECPFSAQSCQIPSGLCVEDYTMPELVLHGCIPEPLMLYLKELGILQIVAEQTGAEAREAWRLGVVLLSWPFDEDTLTGFFWKTLDPLRS
jgi:hypothetical protein